MIYSLYYLWGYGLELDDLKNFRQLDSKTPGHLESGHTEGVEITTGPLGQGVANAVGFAMASAYAGNLVNSETADVIDHNVYCLCGDGDLEEGVSYEACSVAGHLGLDNLILIYDSNRITIEGSTDLSISEDVRKRFEAQNWEVLEADGHDFDAIDSAIEAANIVVLNDHLKMIPYLIKLGRETLNLIRFNTTFALVVKLLFVTLAVFGLSNLALAIFADVGVTLIVILNSLRLLKFN